MSRITWAIDKIDMSDRHRRKLGDVSSLAASINTVGLLHPPVITPNGRLVAGQRRIEACKQLGWRRVPVTVVSDLDTARALLSAESDENTCRLDMTPSEKVALGRALEELERPKAKERQGRPDEPRSGTLPEHSKRGEVREIIGQAVGMSGNTYERAKAVVEASEDESLSPEGRALAINAREEMDRTGKVTPAHDLVAPLIGRKPVNLERGLAARPSSNGVRVGTKTYRGRSATKGVRAVIGTLIGLGSALQDARVDDIGLTAEEARRWSQELRGVAAAIAKVRKQLGRLTDGKA